MGGLILRSCRLCVCVYVIPQQLLLVRVPGKLLYVACGSSAAVVRKLRACECVCVCVQFPSSCCMCAHVSGGGPPLSACTGAVAVQARRARSWLHGRGTIACHSLPNWEKRCRLRSQSPISRARGELITRLLNANTALSAFFPQ